jgi:hypothetical protein
VLHAGAPGSLGPTPCGPHVYVFVDFAPLPFRAMLPLRLGVADQRGVPTQCPLCVSVPGDGCMCWNALRMCCVCAGLCLGVHSPATAGTVQVLQQRYVRPGTNPEGLRRPCIHCGGGGADVKDVEMTRTLTQGYCVCSLNACVLLFFNHEKEPKCALAAAESSVVESTGAGLPSP